jgi:glucokinase
VISNRGSQRQEVWVKDNPNSEFVVGVDLGGTKILAGVVDSSGEVRARSKKRTRPERGTEQVLERLARCVREAIDEAGIPYDQIRSVGVGAPGALDPVSGVIAEAPNLGWRNFALKQSLEGVLELPAVVENDVNAGTWGEFRLGAGVGTKNLVGIFVGTGIGGGLVLEGRLYRGSKGKAGEIGHVKIAPKGPPCGCGQEGCFESLASRLAIQREYGIAAKRGKKSSVLRAVEGDISRIRSGIIAEGYESGDKLTRSILKKTALRLAEGVAAVAALLNPEMIVLGGGLMEALPDEFFESVLDKIERRTFQPSLDGLRVERAMLGDDAVLLGAACIAREWQA